MRFLILSHRKEGALRDHTPLQTIHYFERVQEYFDARHAEGVLRDEGRLVGHHGRFQIYEVESRERLDEILGAAPNATCMDRTIYQVDSMHNTLAALRSRFGMT